MHVIYENTQLGYTFTYLLSLRCPQADLDDTHKNMQREHALKVCKEYKRGMLSQASLTPTKVGTADYFRLSLSTPPWHMSCLHYISSCKHPSEENRENKEAHLDLCLM